MTSRLRVPNRQTWIIVEPERHHHDSHLLLNGILPIGSPRSAIDHQRLCHCLWQFDAMLVQPQPILGGLHLLDYTIPTVQHITHSSSKSRFLCNFVGDRILCHLYAGVLFFHLQQNSIDVATLPRDQEFPISCCQLGMMLPMAVLNESIFLMAGDLLQNSKVATLIVHL